MKRRALAPATYNARRLVEEPIPREDLVNILVDGNQNDAPAENNNAPAEQDPLSNIDGQYEFSEGKYYICT